MQFIFIGVTGHIVDVFGKPMKNATVKLLHTKRVIPIDTNTGFFAINLAPGSYIFSCKYSLSLVVVIVVKT